MGDLFSYQLEHSRSEDSVYNIKYLASPKKSCVDFVVNASLARIYYCHVPVDLGSNTIKKVPPFSSQLQSPALEQLKDENAYVKLSSLLLYYLTELRVASSSQWQQHELPVLALKTFSTPSTSAS